MKETLNSFFKGKVLTYQEFIELIKKAGADEKVIALKSLEALSTLAEGNSTKIIVPSDLSNIATLGTTVKEMLKNDK